MDTIGLIKQRLEILYEMVENLEREGGGGGQGGTDNYNDLSNKPQINSITLSGNKSLADLGIAAASTTYTKTQVDTALSSKANMTDVYGVGGAIALNADLDDYTTAGNYYSDSSATSASLSNCPHTTSIFQLFVYIPYGVNVHQLLYPISAGSNGFYYKRMKTTQGWTAWTKFSSYGMGTAIAANTDLDTMTTPGMYYCNNATTAAGLLHCPVSTLFHMEVKCTTASTRFVQEIVQAGSGDAPTTYKRLYTSGGWSAWYKFEGTVVS